MSASRSELYRKFRTLAGPAIGRAAADALERTQRPRQVHRSAAAT